MSGSKIPVDVEGVKHDRGSSFGNARLRSLPLFFQ